MKDTKTLDQAMVACYGQNGTETPAEIEAKSERYTNIRNEAIGTASVVELATSLVEQGLPQFIGRFGKVNAQNFNKLLILIAASGIAHGIPVGIEIQKPPLVTLLH